MTDLMLRPWASGDQLEELLDADADPLWVSQGHAWHGADRAAPRWKRTLSRPSGDSGETGEGLPFRHGSGPRLGHERGEGPLRPAALDPGPGGLS
jgi:hypothetical protein